MKKIVLVIGLVMSVFANQPVLNLNGLHLYNARDLLNYINVNDKRNLILIFSSKSCSHCVTFKNQLASISKKQYLNSKYIFGIAEDDGELNKMFNVTTTPTTFVMNQSKQLLVQPMVGDPQNVEEFVSYLIGISKN